MQWLKKRKYKFLENVEKYDFDFVYILYVFYNKNIYGHIIENVSDLQLWLMAQNYSMKYRVFLTLTLYVCKSISNW